MLPFAPMALFGVSVLIPVLGALIGWRYALARRLPGWSGVLLGLGGPIGWLALAALGGEATGGWGGPAEEEAPGWHDGPGQPSPRFERWARRLYRPTLFGWGATIVGLTLFVALNAGSARPAMWMPVLLACIAATTVLGTFLLWGLGFSMLLSDTRLPRRRRAGWSAALLWLSAPAALLVHRWRWRRLRALDAAALAGGPSGVAALADRGGAAAELPDGPG